MSCCSEVHGVVCGHVVPVPSNAAIWGYEPKLVNRPSLADTLGVNVS